MRNPKIRLAIFFLFFILNLWFGVTALLAGNIIGGAINLGLLGLMVYYTYGFTSTTFKRILSDVRYLVS